MHKQQNARLKDFRVNIAYTIDSTKNYLTIEVLIALSYYSLFN